MIEQLINLKDAPEVLERKGPQGLQTAKWVEAGRRHVQLEGC